MKRILCPTDFSEEANFAVEAGYYLAKKFDAEFHLFHVIESGSGGDFNVQGASGSGGTSMEDLFFLKLIDATKKRMADLVSTPGLGEINVTSDIKVGKPAELIFEEVDSGDYDMIVMGTKGASGFKEMMVGSNAEKVVRRAQVPVLTVKAHEDGTSFGNIIYASSFAEEEDDVFISKVKKFQELFDSTIHLLRVNTPNNFKTDSLSRKLMQKFVEKHALTQYTFNVYNDTIEEDGIQYFADEIDAGIIAMVTHGRTGFAHLLSGSIAEDVVNHSQKPVLTYNQSN
jgi:nucleotide-binding universal stress UspA family protein